MNFSDLIKIGTLGNSIDRNGMIRFKLLPQFIDIKLNDLFLIFKNNKVRYVSVINEDNSRGSRFILDDTESMAEAVEEKSVILALPKDEIDNKLLESETINLMDYSIFFGNRIIGEVIDSFDNSVHQTITILTDDGDDFMIPVVEKYILKIDPSEKMIIVQDIEELRDL